MKRTMLIVGGLLALATTVYVGTRLWAQGTGTPTAPAQTRVAFVNIEIVFQKYNKALIYKAEMEKTIAPFRTKAETLKTNIQGWQRVLDDPTSSTKIKDFNRDQYVEAIKNAKRELEDLSTQVGKIVGKKNEEQVVQLYKEVSDAVQAYALDHGFQAVLSYGESTKLAPFSFENISRKVQGMEGTGCLSFMYVAPGLDISQAVTDTLNSRYSPTAGTGTSGGIVPTGGKK